MLIWPPGRCAGAVTRQYSTHPGTRGQRTAAQASRVQVEAEYGESYIMRKLSWSLDFSTEPISPALMKKTEASNCLLICPFLLTLAQSMTCCQQIKTWKIQPPSFPSVIIGGGEIIRKKTSKIKINFPSPFLCSFSNFEKKKESNYLIRIWKKYHIQQLFYLFVQDWVLEMSFTSVFIPEQMYSAKSGSPPAGKGREAVGSALYDYTCSPLAPSLQVS